MKQGTMRYVVVVLCGALALGGCAGSMAGDGMTKKDGMADDKGMMKDDKGMMEKK